MEILVAGVGNLLRRDDGFGVAVAHSLAQRPLPPGVRVIEVGIGGIHLVQELLGSVPDVLVVVDAVDLGRPPGTVVLLRPDVEDVASLPVGERHDRLADMHYAVPERALMLAAGLGCLPDATWLVGCQPAETHPGQGLTDAVGEGVAVAVDEIARLVSELGVPWDQPRP